MKPVIIIAIAFVLLVPIPNFAQSVESLPDDKLIDLEERVKKLETKSVDINSLQFWIGVGLIFELAGVAALAKWWSKFPSITHYLKWQEKYPAFFNNDEPPELRDKDNASWMYFNNVKGSDEQERQWTDDGWEVFTDDGLERQVLYILVPNAYKERWRGRGKYFPAALVTIGFLLQIVFIAHYTNF